MRRRLLLTVVGLFIATTAILALTVDDAMRRGKRWMAKEWHGRHVADFVYGYASPGDSSQQYLKVVPRRTVRGLLVLPETVPGGNPTHFEEAILHGRAAGARIMTFCAHVGITKSDD